MHQWLATFTYGGNRYLCIKFTLICQRRKTLCLQWSYASVKLETLRWFCTNLLRSKHIHASWLQIWDKVTYLLYIELIFAYMAKTVVSHRIWHITYILFKKKKPFDYYCEKCGNILTDKAISTVKKHYYAFRKTEQPCLLIIWGRRWRT